MVRRLLAAPLVLSAACGRPVPPVADVVIELPDGECRAEDTCAADLGTAEVRSTRVAAFLVTNLGDAPAEIVNVALEGDPSVRIEQAPAPELGPGRSTPAVLSWTARSPTTVTAALSVLWSEAGGPQRIIDVELSAAGTSIVPVVGPTRCDFGDVPVGSTSAPCNITIENHGGGDLAITDIGLGDNAFGPVGFVAVPIFVPPGEAMSLPIVATPIHPGTATGLVALEVDDSSVYLGMTTLRVNGL